MVSYIEAWGNMINMVILINHFPETKARHTHSNSLQCVAVSGNMYGGQLQPAAVSRRYLTVRYFQAAIPRIASHCSVYGRELQCT